MAAESQKKNNQMDIFNEGGMKANKKLLSAEQGG